MRSMPARDRAEKETVKSINWARAHEMPCWAQKEQLLERSPRRKKRGLIEGSGKNWECGENIMKPSSPRSGVWQHKISDGEEKRGGTQKIGYR